MRFNRPGLAAISIAWLAIYACSPAPKAATEKPAVAAPIGALLKAAGDQAAAQCATPATPKTVGAADFDGDGVAELVVDWTEVACAKTDADVCTPKSGCLRQVWRDNAATPTRIFQGFARDVRVETQTAGPTLVVDQAGDVCGRPDPEICRTIFRWEPRSQSLQETAREIVAAKP